MAHMVNADTTLSRRAGVQRVWLVALYLAAALLLLNGGRLVLAQLGGPQRLARDGVAHVAKDTALVLTGQAAHAPWKTVARRWLPPIMHLMLLFIVMQLTVGPRVTLRAEAAQRHVHAELERLPDDYWVLNDLRVPGQGDASQVDHVLVSPAGVWCLETCDHVGLIRGGEFDYEWHQYRAGAVCTENNCQFFNPVRQNTTHCAGLTNVLMLQKLDVPVRSMVIFTSAQLDVMTMTPVEPLKRAIDTILGLEGEQRLDDYQVERVVGVLSGLLATEPSPTVALRPAESFQLDATAR